MSAPASPARPRGYSAVTPARDEIDNLRRLEACLAAQTRLPDAWIVVDDGSTDGTRELAEQIAATHAWAHVIDSPGAAQKAGGIVKGRSSGRDVVAFNAGVRALPAPSDIVLKLDADVSFEAAFFEGLLDAFAADAELGIAGGICLELEDGSWVERHVTGDHVRGAVRAYRRACLEDVSPLVERLGWDGIDELKARTLGWRTRSVPELPFRHHRALGSRDGRWAAWAGQGDAAHFMGYRPSYLLLRTVHHMRRDPHAIAMLGSYLGAVAGRRPTYGDPAVRRRLRDEQRLRFVRSRKREADGRPSPT